MTLSTISLKPRCVVNKEDCLIPRFCLFRTPCRKISRERPWNWVQIFLAQQMQLCFRPDLSMGFRLSFSGDLTCGTELTVAQTAALRPALYFLFWKAQMVGKLLSTLQHADGHCNLGGVRVWARWACAPPSLCLNNELSWDKQPRGSHCSGPRCAHSTWEPEVVMGAHVLCSSGAPSYAVSRPAPQRASSGQKKLINSGSMLFETA